MTEYTAQQFTVTPDPGDPSAELSLRKVDQNSIPLAQIAFGNDSYTYLSFQSNPGGTMAEQMRIHTNGNVGIGTATPGEKLDVSGTVRATAFDGNLNGSQITTGTVAAARIDAAILRTSDLAVPNGIATLDTNALVVQNPSNATRTPTASKISIADASGKLAAGWGGNASTLATLDGNTRLVQSANTVWDGTAARSASATPTANTIPVLNASAKFPGSITGDADTVDTFHASSTPAADTIAVGNASGKLASGWGGSASTLATLDASSLVVQNPANATATPTASKIPIADASGKLAAGWGGNANTLATLDTNSRLVQAANTVWDGTAGRSASPNPAANTIPVGNASGKLAFGWSGSASILATLDASFFSCSRSCQCHSYAGGRENM